jgi:hypothetical protein
MQTRTLLTLLAGAALLSSTAAAQDWANSRPEGQFEVAVQAGYGFYRNVTASSSAGTAKAGFASGALFSAVGTDNMYNHLGGEIRYIYSQSDLKLSGSQTVKFGGESHTFDYNFLLYGTGNDAPVRPFVAGGAGMKLFRGTGTESALQPLSNIAILTKTHQVEPEVNVGVGIKFKVGKHGLFRVDARDYMSPIPKDVIAPAPPSGKMSGWLHDFVAMVGFGARF